MEQNNPTNSLEFFEENFQNPSPSWDSYAQSWHPYIPNEKKRKVRNLFGIETDETILSIHNSAAFWNSLSSATVLTDKSIYYLSEDKTTNFKIPLAEVSSVSFQDNAFYFYDLNGELGATLGIYDLISPDSQVMNNESQIGEFFAQLLSGMASFLAPVDPTAIHDEEIERLTNEHRIDDAIQYIQQLITQDDGTYKAYWYYRLSCIVANKEDTANNEEQAAKYCMEGLKYCEEGSPVSIWLRNKHRNVSLASSLEETDKLSSGAPIVSMSAIKLLRWESLWVSQNATDQKLSDGRLMKEDAGKDFEDMNEQYCHDFIRQPYNERKVLFVVKDYTDLRQDSLCVIRKSDIPSNMSFPIGHPQEGQIYVGHPFIPAKYVPFEEYELEFIEDKVREFVWLMQCQGATKISISAKNDNEQSGDYSSNKNISGNSSYGVAKVNGSYSSNSKGSLAEQICKAISLNQDFKPTKAPYIPDGLVWYKNEPSWQRLVNQRMAGSLLHASESIETRKSNMVNGTELQTIKVEFHSLVSINGEWTKEEESKFHQQENATLTFEIDFAPLESLEKEGSQNMKCISATSTTTSDNEQEYLNEVKECLADGEIGPRERRLLDKLASKFGISLARAAELEASLSAPKLTTEEKEYYEEVKAVLVDGEISEKEKRLLDKLRKMLNISEERAKEIESMR